MNGGVEASRQKAESSIYRRFGEAIERAEKNIVENDPSKKRLAAARVSLEYAVMKTALEHNIPTRNVVDSLDAATPAQQAMMVKAGRAEMERAYASQPEVIVGALAGKLVEVPMPKGFVSNPEFDRLIDTSRNLVTQIVNESYQKRGVFQDAGMRSDYVALSGDKSTTPARAELAGRVAFIESAIDASLAKGQMTGEAAQMLKERVEAFIFQPRPPQSLSYTPEFTKFYETQGKQMRSEVMKEVREVTGHKTVADIAEKLDKTLKAFEPPQRAREAIER